MEAARAFHQRVRSEGTELGANGCPLRPTLAELSPLTPAVSWRFEHLGKPCPVPRRDVLLLIPFGGA